MPYRRADAVERGAEELASSRRPSINRPIYMDYAATAPMKPAVLEAMLPWLRDRFGNPSSVHRWGRAAREALDQARETVAAALGCEPAEIVFTSGGTEADNLALKGVARAAIEGAAGSPGSGPAAAGAAPRVHPARRRIVTSAVEHHAVLHSARSLERLGFPVTYLPVDGDGLVKTETVRAALEGELGGAGGGPGGPAGDGGRRAGTGGTDVLLVSLMYANNEVGTIQPVEEVGRLCREYGVLFHVDAVQAFGKLPVSVDRLQCSLLSLSGHKIGGPKGVGCLYVRRGTPLAPHMDGGAQEREMRAGTENVAGIVGFAAAVELAVREQEREAARLARLADRLAALIVERVPGVRRTGSPTRRVPGLVHLIIDGVDAESLLLNLDLQGIAASSGSACASGSLEPSHVLLAMGMTKEEARGSLRLSLGWDSHEGELEPVAEALQGIVERLRSRRRGGAMASPGMEGRVLHR